MRVLVSCSLGGSGHWNPLLPFLRAAIAQGHDVLATVPPGLEAMVASAGVAYRVGGDPPADTVTAIRDRLPTVSAEEGSILGNRELFGRLCTAAMLPVVEEVVAEWRPDLVVRDPCEYASAVAAARHRVPVAQVAISLAEVESGSLRVAAPALRLYGDEVVDEIFRSPYVTRFPASLDPSPFPDTRRFREEVPQGATALPDWWNGASGPVIYASLGTVVGHMESAREAFRTLLHALANVEARVLLTVGRVTDRDALGTSPVNVHVERWVPQSDVFAHAGLVVCHGGSGTVFGALAAGLPLVVVPLFGDQFTNAARVAEAGAGIVVERAGVDRSERRLLSLDDAPAITRAVETVLGDARYRGCAGRIADETMAAPTAAEVLDRLVSSVRS